MHRPHDPGRVEQLKGYDQVVMASGGDPCARWSLDPAAQVQGATLDGAVLWTVRREHYTNTTWATALGPLPAVADLVSAVLADPQAAGLDPVPGGITVPFGAMELIDPAVRPPEHGEWVWWWTDEPPPRRAGEDDVVELPVGDPGNREELAALLRVASPTASTTADDDRVRTWAAVRGEHGLVACGADRPYEHGVPHLASIATLPDQRGRGLGSAVTAWLTRRRLVDDEAAVVTLGMYADNDVARTLYERLGFHAAHHFTSGDLRGRAGPH